MSKKTFVINDESINSYGFKVLTAGISLERFNTNRVCLKDHKNSTDSVLGTWEDLKTENNQLLGSPSFNTQNEEDKEVIRKVEEGVIKACSMGINFKIEDLIFSTNNEMILTKCELMEVSIVPVPSNANAIALYDDSGKMLSEEDIKKLCLSAQQNQTFNSQNTMKNVLIYLQLEANADETAVIAGIKAIEAKLTASETDNTALKGKVTALETAEKERQDKELQTELTLAVKDGRIDEAGKEPILEMPYQSAMKLLKALPKRKSIQEQVDENGKVKDLDRFDKLSWHELDKQNLLQGIKLNHADYYAQRFEQQYGKKPSK